jgi:hypothetical protein
VHIALLALALAVQNQPLPPAPPPPPAAVPAPPPAAKRSLEFTGLILVNGFFNDARVNNSDVPQFALADTNPAGAGGGTLRQTRLQLFVTEPEVLGGQAAAELDVDFFGGQPAAGGRTFPLLRLRRATATVTWSHAELMFGQEAPLVAGREPRSLAAVGFPNFASAGNLWLWIPQARVSFTTGYTLRVALQGALLAPTQNGTVGAFLTQPDSAERTGRPFAQGRLRLGWGPADDPSEIALGGHIGWLRSLDTTTGDTLIQTRAITLDARIRLGEVEILGEVFAGQALSVLGGGGIGQLAGVGGVPVRTKGGWGQLNLRLRRSVTVGGGCGIDDPDDADLPTAPNAARLRNLVCAGMIEWRPQGPLVFGLELRRLTTDYSTNQFTVTHLNVAAGWRW